MDGRTDGLANWCVNIRINRQTLTKFMKQYLIGYSYFLKATLVLWDTATCFKMADKTTSLTSHSLFPASNQGLGLDDISGSFSFAPTLVPTSTSPVAETSTVTTTQDVVFNPG